MTKLADMRTCEIQHKKICIKQLITTSTEHKHTAHNQNRRVPTFRFLENKGFHGSFDHYLGLEKWSIYQDPSALNALWPI